MRRRFTRLYGLTTIGVRRIRARLTTNTSGGLLAAVAAVTVTIALMTTVSGIALGLASQSAIQSEDVDYWVVPDATTPTAIAASVQGPKLGNVHAASTRLTRDDRIEYATPVETSLIRVTNGGGEGAYVLALGIVVPETPRTVAGLSTRGLTPGDPHYANGTYSGPWTGEAVISGAAAEVLDVQRAATLDVETGDTARTLTVRRVAENDVSTGVGPVPVVIVHLSELQTISGATSGDAASQLLVSTTDPSVQSDIEAVYPGTTVVTRTGLSQTASLSSLPLAIALAAFVTSVVVGVLFVATMMGLELLSDRETLAVFTALGYSARSVTVLVLVETLSITVVGGVLGVSLGVLGIEAVNLVSGQYLGVAPALVDPRLLGYGVAIALGIGIVAALYPVWLYRRVPALEVLSR